jgi:glycosyltransferase involved in cell wall biosynthesis
VGRRVLLIAQAYYPCGISGAHRPAKMAKYLPQYGWTPTVVCADSQPGQDPLYDPLLAARPDVCRVVRVPYPPRPALKAMRGLDLAMGILFPYRAPFGFSRDMLDAAERLVAEEHYDAVWSTCWPGLTHYVANRLKRRHGIPWVADFRDLPDQDFPFLKLKYTVRAEVRLCRTADALVTVSRPLADTLARRYRVPVHAILNGFDPDDYPPAEPAPCPTFNIGYFGILYRDRDPCPLFAAMDLLLKRGDVEPGSASIQFYGDSLQYVGERIRQFQCYPMIEVHQRVPHEEMVRLQQRAAVLLLLSGEASRGVMTAKIFGYLAARRPILDIPGGDVTKPLLLESRAGACGATPEEIAAVLLKWYKEWKQTGTVAYNPDVEKVGRYSRQQQAGELAQVLESVAAPRD